MVAFDGEGSPLSTTSYKNRERERDVEKVTSVVGSLTLIKVVHTPVTHPL